MVVFPRVMGHQWTNFEEASIVAAIAAFAFVFTGGLCINFVIFKLDNESDTEEEDGSKENDPRSPVVHPRLALQSDFSLRVVLHRISTVFQSLHARAFLVTEFLACIAHTMIMAGFPLFCKYAAETGVLPKRVYLLGRYEVTLGARDQIPALYGVLYFAATCSGFVWAYCVRSKLLSPTMTWRVSSSLYATSLIWLMSADSIMTAAIRVCCIGINMSAFLILPEMLLGRAVDELRAADTHGGNSAARGRVLARSVTLVKQMVRRVAGVIQGVLVGYLLSFSGYREGTVLQTPQAIWAITAITCLIPAISLTLSGLPMKYLSDKSKEQERKRAQETEIEIGEEIAGVDIAPGKHSKSHQRKVS